MCVCVCVCVCACAYVFLSAYTPHRRKVLLPRVGGEAVEGELSDAEHEVERTGQHEQHHHVDEDTRQAQADPAVRGG